MTRHNARLVRTDGFTLIELIIVMAIVALLVTIAAPRYMRSLEKSKEAVLKEDLWVMRDALDKYYGDLGKYPGSLEELVEQKYLRGLLHQFQPLTGAGILPIDFQDTPIVELGILPSS